ncbi:hypothetical protein N9Y42_07880 [Mariniblastus sp.]|nr:hypothetical protein [Mariniblastus sp.]
MPNISVPEQRVCEMLTPLLRSHAVGDAIGPRPAGNYLFSSLEFFLPEVLRELHDEWRHESLDGLYPKIFRKTNEREIEFVGLTIFITDQTFTPIHLHLQLASDYDRVSWIDLKLGERIGDKCRREPYSRSQTTGTMLHVAERLETIDWFYHVGYGERET